MTKVRDLKPGMKVTDPMGNAHEIKLTEIMNGQNGEKAQFIGGSEKTALAVRVHFLDRDPIIAHPNENVSNSLLMAG